VGGWHSGTKWRSFVALEGEMFGINFVSLACLAVFVIAATAGLASDRERQRHPST
jgi:hypothetical protein